ncbi:hypothetical protein HOY82DRAFT_612499 [Tuber indicum]|nr:hypothetical protein HOY82DRAFT_612499 [Tuber indicum]
MFLGPFFILSLFFLGAHSDDLIRLPSPVTHDPEIANLFSQIYSVAGPDAPTDPVTLNQTRTKILTLLSTPPFPPEVLITSQHLHCETSQGSPAYADVASAISQLYRRTGQECNSNSGCEEVQGWGSAEIGVCGPFGYSWDCKDVGGMAFWIAANCWRDLGAMKVGGRYLFDRWWTGYPADVRIYSS